MNKTTRNVNKGGGDVNRKKIAKKLIELRGDKSRAEVAKALNISLSAIAMYENGERIPRDEVKIAIADYYGVSVADIFF